MTSTLRTMTFLVAVLALALATTAARANTVDIVHDGFGAHSTLLFWGAGHEGSEAVAGVYMLDKTDGTGIGETWSDGPIPGFCMELHELAPKSTYTYQVTMPDNVYNSYIEQTLGTTKANYLRELWARHYDDAWASSAPSTQQHLAAEAFAAAVWEIVYEDMPSTPAGWDVTIDGTPGRGGFRAELLDTATANKWLQDLTGCGPKVDVRTFVYCGQQEYLVAVPEPTTVVLLGLGGLLSLAGRRRTRA